jgi:hypothetical protein
MMKDIFSKIFGFGKEEKPTNVSDEKILTCIFHASQIDIESWIKNPKFRLVF